MKVVFLFIFIIFITTLLEFIETVVVCLNVHKFHHFVCAKLIPDLCVNKAKCWEISLQCCCWCNNEKDLHCKFLKSWMLQTICLPILKRCFDFLFQHFEFKWSYRLVLIWFNEKLSKFLIHSFLMRIRCCILIIWWNVQISSSIDDLSLPSPSPTYRGSRRYTTLCASPHKNLKKR